MKIKSRVWYWLAAASGAVSLLYGMSIEGGAQLGSSISDNQFVTALCLVLAAVAFLRLGFAAQDREPAAMAALTAPTPVPKSRSTGKTGGAHEKQMSPPVLVTRTSPKGDGIHKPHHP
jgi:hypothetical protein